MQVHVNKQMELICGLLQCSNYVKIVPMQCEDTGNEFRKRNIDFLSQFKNEKVFQLLNELVNDKSAYFVWDAPTDIALCMDEKYNFFGHNSKVFCGKLHKNPKVLEFLKELKIFAEKIDYNTFFLQHKDYFLQITENHKKVVDVEVDKVFEFMTKFYMFKPKQEQYSMNLLLSVSWTGVGTQVDDKVYISDSLKFNKNKGWQFLHHDNNQEYIAHILHEFSHPVVNPLTDKQQINSSFIPDWPYICSKLGPGYAGFFKPYINESLIRAIQIYFLEKAYNYPTGERILREERNGYLHTRALVKKLYDIEHNSYKKFEDKYVDLLKVLTKELDKDVFLQ